MKNLYLFLNIKFNIFFLYRFGMNKIYVILFIVMDEDDDVIKCCFFQYVEVGLDFISYRFYKVNVDVVSLWCFFISEFFVKKLFLFILKI